MPGDWAFWLAGLALALGGVALLTFALFGDWFKHRGTLRRCPKCWYDLSGTKSLTCPECGRTFKREKKLHKSRRRWKRVFASVLVFALAGIAAIQPKVRRDGWLSVMPTTVVILKVNSSEASAAFEVLQQRTTNDFASPGPDSHALFRWQYRLLGEMCIKRAASQLTVQEKVDSVIWLSHVAALADEPYASTYFAAALAYLDDPHPRVRSTAGMSCANGRFIELTIKSVRPLLDDSISQVRTAAVIGLGWLGEFDPEPESVLIECLSHSDADVRSTASRMLARMSDSAHTSDEVFDELLRAYQSEEDSSVRASYLYSLSQFSHRSELVIELLRNAADHSDALMRREVLDSISTMPVIDEDFETEVAIAGIQDESADVRNAADWLLFNRIPVKNLKPHQELFESFMESEDEYLKHVGAVVLERIRSGQ